MAIYELHKVINKKDEEIAKLTKALVFYMKDDWELKEWQDNIKS